MGSEMCIRDRTLSGLAYLRICELSLPLRPTRPYIELVACLRRVPYVPFLDSVHALVQCQPTISMRRIREEQKLLVIPKSTLRSTSLRNRRPRRCVSKERYNETVAIRYIGLHYGMVVIGHSGPIYNIPPCSDVIAPTRPVILVIRMLPNV